MSADAELARFRQNPNEALKELYRRCRNSFVNWAKSRSTFDEDMLTDVFQESVIILWDNIRTGRLVELTATLDTYLFAIGKRVLLVKARKAIRLEFPGEEKLRLPDEFDFGIEYAIMKAEEKRQLLAALQQLGEPCHALLKLTYYEEKKSAEIAELMDYSSDDVVRQQRRRCIERLRKLFNPHDNITR